MLSRSSTAVGVRLASSAAAAPVVVPPTDKTALPAPRASGRDAAFKKGGGGRASFSGNVVTVFGATGWMGQAVVNRLARSGNQIIIPYRCEPYFCKELKVSGELGQIHYTPFDLTDDASIRKAIKYSNVVLNLIGTRYETSNFSYYDVHETGARRLARLARESGVDRFIHLSSLGASLDPPATKRGYVSGGSQYLRSKGRGERAVRDEFPDATIIRPGLVYGENDSFIFQYLSRYRKTPLDTVYLWKGGEQTFKMPVFINDVVSGIERVVREPNATLGKTYEFVGPHAYRLSELIDYLYYMAHCRREHAFTYRRHDLPDPYFWLLTFLTEKWGRFFAVNTPLNREWMEYVECINDELTGVPTLLDLGVTRLAEFEPTGGTLARHCSFKKDYEERYGETAPPLPLRSLPLRRRAIDEAGPAAAL